MPFSWFLHKIGREDLKITSASCFSLRFQRKDSKKAKEHRQFRGVLGRWRTVTIDRTTFHACQRCRKTAVLGVNCRVWGPLWWVKAFSDQQCQFLTRNKSLSSENNRNVRWLLSAGVPIQFCLGAPAASTVDVNSGFLAFNFRHFGRTAKLLASSFLLRFGYGFFFILIVYARTKIRCHRFFNFDLRKSYASSQPTG